MDDQQKLRQFLQRVQAQSNDQLIRQARRRYELARKAREITEVLILRLQTEKSR